ncbi:hypothetical protein J4416_00700 [Candidatus Pacearchaeota archaeon]|nr:hypothetical protein [Candidatus Pacearchaeota archaeon]
MARDVPIHEITLRKYEKPYDSSRREIIRKICLSIGLLQPGDSRDIVVDILLALEDARKEKKELTSIEVRNIVMQMRQDNSLETRGIAESNIRRQLKRLRDLMIVDKKNNLYRISEFAPLHDLFEQKIEKFLIPQTINRIKEYMEVLNKN